MVSTLKTCGSLVATVAVLGVRVRPMPEFRVSLMLPVFLVSCCDCAVMTIWSPGNFVWSGMEPGAV